MDFTSLLSNLERTANAASSQRTASIDGEDHRRRGHASPDHSYGGARKRQRRGPPNHPHNAPRHRHAHGSNEPALRRALASLPHYRPTPLSTTASSPETATPRHICLLVISITDLPYEHIWKAWAASDESTTSTTYVSLIGHAKYPRRVQSEWFRSKLLVEPPKLGRGREYQPPTYHSRNPDWGSIEITRAMLDLLHEGLRIGQDDKESDPRFSTRRFTFRSGAPSTSQRETVAVPPVDKFIFVSETCLPVVTLEEMQLALFDNPTTASPLSWVNARNTPNNGYSRQLQFDKVHAAVPKHCVSKADQWMVLSRAHARAVMDLDRNLPRDCFLWQCFTETKASDELYFPTALSLLGIVSCGEVNIRRVTYADWSVSARNPASFTKGVQDLTRVARLARAEGCLLARKFAPCEILTASVGPAAATTGVLHDEEEASGNITVDEWKSVLRDVAADKEAVASS